MQRQTSKRKECNRPPNSPSPHYNPPPQLSFASLWPNFRVRLSPQHPRLDAPGGSESVASFGLRVW